MNIEKYVKCASLEKFICDADTAAKLINDNMTVAFGGQVSVGCPKAIPEALAKRAENGDTFKINVFTTSNNVNIDDALAEKELVSRRFPMTDSRILAKQANSNVVSYVEQQMNKVPNLLKSGKLGKIDYTVVEALYITEDGAVVPTTSVGNEPLLLDLAENIIIEINIAQPEFLSEFIDIYRKKEYEPIPLNDLNKKIGNNFICIDVNKVKAIVFTEIKDNVPNFAPVTESQKKLSENLVNFLKAEKTRMSWDKLPPIQTGFGNLANCIIEEIEKSDLKDISFFAGHLQEANIKLLLSGKAVKATCSSIQLSEDIIQEFKSKINELKDKLVIRNSDLINNSEIISRFMPITLTTGIEMDIYGNVNSSHISGARVVNGLGGGANFAENAGLSVFMMVSENKGGAISTIVPMVSHQDISEHDIDVVITENGVADLRGLSDIERAEAIIENCTSSYKEQLKDYLSRAKNLGGHHPIILDEALSWHKALKENGTMKNEVE